MVQNFLQMALVEVKKDTLALKEIVALLLAIVAPLQRSAQWLQDVSKNSLLELVQPLHHHLAGLPLMVLVVLILLESTSVQMALVALNMEAVELQMTFV